MASSVLISVGVNKNNIKHNLRPDSTSAITSSAQKGHESDTPDSMSSASSTPEEIPHVSTLALPDLEALLAQQEQRSKEALGVALAKKEKAERLHERARAKEEEAQTFRMRYENTESTIHELRKLIVEKNKQALEKQFETKEHTRASVKRPRVSSESTTRSHHSKS